MPATNLAGEIVDLGEALPEESTVRNLFRGGGAGAALKPKGEANTAFGYEAMEAVTTGQKNEAFGGRALKVLDKGSANVAVGYEAGVAVTTGKENVAVGNKAMATNQTANNNVGVGVNALEIATKGKNTAVGYGACSTETGESNVSVGYGAGPGAGATSQNVLIGQEAGLTLKVTASGNIFIGYQAGAAEGEVSNKLLIANNETTPLIAGVLSGTQKLGFYGVSPTSKAAAIAVPGAFKTGVSGFETEAECKAIRDKLTTVIEALKNIGICA